MTFKTTWEISHLLRLTRTRQGFTGECPSCGYPTGFALREMGDKLLFYCHAGGCSQRELWQTISALGDLSFNQKSPQTRIANIDRRQQVHLLWQRSLPATGTLVETYLRARGLNGPIPQRLQFLPQARHSPSGQTLPVMLAGVSNASGTIVAVHRTFLNQNGTSKTHLQPNKMMLGNVAKCSVHLAPITHEIAISEGIETGLSIMQAAGMPVWAALSAGGLATLELPPLPLAQEVFVCADNDAVGIHRAYRAAERWLIEGRQVRVCIPPKKGQDFNDLLRETHIHAN